MAAPRRSSATRTTARSRSAASRRSAPAGPTPRRPRRVPGFAIAPDTIRSLVGVGLLVLGAVTLIGLALPNAGILNRYVSVILRPNFGQGAWLLAALLLMAGALVERAPKVGTGWGVSAIGGLILFLAGEGLIHLVGGHGGRATELVAGGGKVGNWLSGRLVDLVGREGAFVVLAGIGLAGILLLFNLTLRALLRPVTAGGRAVANVASATVASAASATAAAARMPMEERRERGIVAVPIEPEAPRSRPRRRRNGDALIEEVREPDAPEPDLAPLSSPIPMSQTVWDSRGAAAASAAETSDAADAGRRRSPAEPLGRLTPAAPVGPGGSALSLPSSSAPAVFPASASMSTARGTGTAVAPPPLDGAAEELRDAMPIRTAPVPRTWNLPRVDLLELDSAALPATALDHARNVRIIEEKLRSFQIPATVVATNTGPVVTQYEVKPDARVKLSRIEGLADDLAMALAARSIRIEAPIPGRDVVGIEIPNHLSEVVAFGSLYQDAQMAAATSKLTFALGRDVSGKAYAVDLARMPHLLIAGATGSGKSVCVNALITSLLMRARPDEVNLVLIDLKRVELAQYDGLPHLKTAVIVEAHHARAALGWAVQEMEERYKTLASRAERNIAAYNASPRVEPEERLPYIVIVIDELADLIMREGRKIEDPVVKIAQKARAVGIHLVLATQRPSVNVVTGLIKANVPSRIAFAMSSNVDSRTVLDQPGAEDLIGRGDMLYQPADLPRPVRLQGVFVSDAEVRAVTDAWRAQSPEPDYDPAVLAGGDEEAEGGGQFGWLSQMAEDELTARAAELIMQTGKASTSMMQTKLKVGFNRASRLMDELERYGIVGPQDPRNPAVPRQVYGPDNWVRGPSDMDDL